jgi:hypothetical protein
MDVNELYTIFKNHRHSGTHPDARKLDIKIINSSAAIILISPDGTEFLIGVDDDGALTTQKLSSMGNLVLVSHDGTRFKVEVDNDGALTTTPM